MVPATIRLTSTLAPKEVANLSAVPLLMPRDFDLTSLRDLGIAVSNTPGAADAATANVAMYLLLGALRRAWIPSVALRKGEWRGRMGLGFDPEGKVLGILGMGGIGGAFAKRAAGFDFKVQYHNRRPVGPEKNLVGASYVSFEELLGTSDILSLHLPLTQATRHLIGSKEFGMMKDGVIIINTARGPIIDEQALVDALNSGKVFSAGLDVYEKEPEIHKGLVDNGSVILLPHIGTATYETQVRDQVSNMPGTGKSVDKIAV